MAKKCTIWQSTLQQVADPLAWQKSGPLPDEFPAVTHLACSGRSFCTAGEPAKDKVAACEAFYAGPGAVTVVMAAPQTSRRSPQALAHANASRVRLTSSCPCTGRLILTVAPVNCAAARDYKVICLTCISLAGGCVLSTCDCICLVIVIENRIYDIVLSVINAEAL